MTKTDKEITLKELELKQMKLQYAREDKDKDKDRQLALKFHVIDAVKSVIKTVSALGFPAWAISSLAGKYTYAELKGMPWDSLNPFVIGGCVVIGVGGFAYGFVQKKFKETKIAELTRESTAYKQIKDPERQTSGLTITGKTPPEGE
jgi:hypothetical protein